MSEKRCIVLIIRVTATLTVVMVWIIPKPRQNIGGASLLFTTAAQPLQPLRRL